MFYALALLITLTTFDGSAQSLKNHDPAFDVGTMSERAKKAYESLRHTTQFEGPRLGPGGMLSMNAVNFEIILREDRADEAFKSLLLEGTTAAKLYALCGLFYTDHERFRSEIKRFKSSNQKVQMLSGCIMFERPIRDIIESKAENVAIIGPDESLEQYLTGTQGRGYSIDIANGGYPATFLHFVQKEKARRK